MKLENKIIETSLILYLGTAPIYWIPLVDLFLWNSLKYFLFIFLFLSFTIRYLFDQGIKLPNGIYGVGGFLLLFIFYLPGFIQSDLDLVVKRIVDIMYVLLFYIIVHNLSSIINVKKILLKSTIIISIFCLIVLMSFIGLFPDYSSTLDVNQSLQTAGFGGARTGWSSGLALYTSFALYGIYISKSKKILLLYTSIIILIIINQLIVAGRSGLLASFITIIIFIVINKAKKYYLITIITTILITYIYIYSGNNIIEDLRLSDISGQSNIDVKDIDNFSAGRIIQYIYALEGISNNLLFGNGLGKFKELTNGTELHNVWLRLWYESGILLLLIFMYMILLSILQKHRSKNTLNKYMNICLISGCILALFEPNVLIGSFQNSAMWWFSFGIVLKNESNKIVIIHNEKK